jgi:uncharacterized protein (DUF58 family)
VRPVFPALWLSARGVWALLGVAVVIALAGAFPVLLGLAGACVAAYVALVAVDAARGPRARDLRLTRLDTGNVALRRRGELGYRLENRAAVAIRAGIYETPAETLDFESVSVEVAVRARGYAEARLGFLPRERGRVELAAVYLWVENAFGLLRRRYIVATPLELRVFPDLSAIESRGVLARRATALQAGLRKLRMRGAGSEFESLREYLPGDGFRAIDWKASARRGRLMVEQYEAERNQQILVLLDAGRLMLARLGPQRKFDYALTAGLSVARIAQAAGDNVGFIAFGAKPLLTLAPRRGTAHSAALTQAAFDLQPRREEPDYETVLTGVKQRYTKRSLIVLFSDMFDPSASAALLAGLATLVPRHLVMCVLMNDEAIAKALDAPPQDTREAYRTSVAMLLADERTAAIATLRAKGVIVVDVPAPQLSVAVLDAYLDVKSRGAL